MQKFIDISDWSELSWFSTGGTRAKKYVQSPEDKYYYFKRSQYKDPTETKPGKDFRFEFWNEIIAYEVGKILGFNMLPYAIAYDGYSLGCISESMIDAEKEQLVEGVKFLQSFNPYYQPNNKEHRNLYSFQSIENALEKFSLHRFKDNIVEVIIFDSLIGNGDRHQENWALIWEHEVVKKVSNVDDVEAVGGIYDFKSIRFAPIYDSGSSLGRELKDSRVNELLTSKEELNKYIGKGVAEIHWDYKKVSHFELIEKLLNTPYQEVVVKIINRVVKNFTADKIQEAITMIDTWVPEFLQQHKLPDLRKELIREIILSRFERLKELIHA